MLTRPANAAVNEHEHERAESGYIGAVLGRYGPHARLVILTIPTSTHNPF